MARPFPPVTWFIICSRSSAFCQGNGNCFVMARSFRFVAWFITCSLRSVFVEGNSIKKTVGFISNVFLFCCVGTASRNLLHPFWMICLLLRMDREYWVLFILWGIWNLEGTVFLCGDFGAELHRSSSSLNINSFSIKLYKSKWDKDKNAKLRRKFRRSF